VPIGRRLESTRTRRVVTEKAVDPGSESVQTRHSCIGIVVHGGWWVIDPHPGRGCNARAREFLCGGTAGQDAATRSIVFVTRRSSASTDSSRCSSFVSSSFV
jgi:hypothetical protein